MSPLRHPLQEPEPVANDPRIRQVVVIVHCFGEPRLVDEPDPTSRGAFG